MRKKRPFTLSSALESGGTNRPRRVHSFPLPRRLVPETSPMHSRREALRVGGLSALGLTLPDLLRTRAETRNAASGGGRAKSCIVVFLMGGPPQYSTWDPKPDAPPEVRGEFGPTDTNVPGLRL